nr:hypothetical protein B7L52_07865 [Pectobacterium carotovorum]
MLNCICPSYFKFHVCWLRLLTRITYLSKLLGIPSLAAFLKLELFRASYACLWGSIVRYSRKKCAHRCTYGGRDSRDNVITRRGVGR